MDHTTASEYRESEGVGRVCTLLSQHCFGATWFLTQYYLNFYVGWMEERKFSLKVLGKGVAW